MIAHVPVDRGPVRGVTSIVLLDAAPDTDLVAHRKDNLVDDFPRGALLSATLSCCAALNNAPAQLTASEPTRVSLADAADRLDGDLEILCAPITAESSRYRRQQIKDSRFPSDGRCARPVVDDWR